MHLDTGYALFTVSVTAFLNNNTHNTNKNSISAGFKKEYVTCEILAVSNF